MTATQSRMELPPLAEPVAACLDCGQPLSADFWHGFLQRQGFCEDCIGKHVFMPSDEPDICGAPGCGELHQHADHIPLAEVMHPR